MSDKTKQPAAPAASKTKPVIWTEKGEQMGAHSEHGRHKAGERVETEHAAVLIENGFAKAST